MTTATATKTATTAKRDPNAPAMLFAEVKDQHGKVWAVIPLQAKQFSTGSVGYYGGGIKITNPASPDCQYQVGLNLTLVGSKQ